MRRQLTINLFLIPMLFLTSCEKGTDLPKGSDIKAPQIPDSPLPNTEFPTWGIRLSPKISSQKNVKDTFRN